MWKQCHLDQHSLVVFDPWRVPYQGLSGQSWPGNDCNQGVLRNPQSSCITGTSPSDCLVSYPGHSFGDFYPSEEMLQANGQWKLVFTLGKIVSYFSSLEKKIPSEKKQILWCGRRVGMTQRVSAYILSPALLLKITRWLCDDICVYVYMYIFIYIYIYIISMSRHQQRYLWPFPANLLYRPSLPAGLQGYILYRHRAIVYGISTLKISILVNLHQNIKIGKHVML